VVGPCTHMHRINRAYIKVVREKSLILQVTFSLFTSLSPQTLCSLSSPLCLLLRREVVAARWSAVLDGGGATGVVKTTPFFNFPALSTLLLLLILFLSSKILKDGSLVLDLEFKRKENYLFDVLFRIR